MLAAARRLRGMTQKEAAEKARLSQGRVSKAEHGIITISGDDVARLAGCYALPVEFFAQEPDNTPVGHFYYRRRLTLSERAVGMFEAKAQQIKTITDRLMSAVELPEYSLPAYNASRDTPQDLARKMRYAMGACHGPLPCLATLMENHGVVVMRTDFGTDKIDGLATVTRECRKLVLVNSRQPSDRSRFSLAHELGHLLMHTDTPPSDYASVEDEADAFAAELLMPEADIRDALASPTFATLAQMKRRWRVSMRALVRQARDLGSITQTQYRNMQIAFSKRGYNKCEPVPLPQEMPTLMRETLRLYKEDLGYSDADLCRLMDIGMADYKEWFGISRVWLTPPYHSR